MPASAHCTAPRKPQAQTKKESILIHCSIRVHTIISSVKLKKIMVTERFSQGWWTESQNSPKTLLFFKLRFNWYLCFTCKVPLYFLVNEEEEEQELTGAGGGLSDKVSLYKGDITVLEVDAIVNAGKYLPSFCSAFLLIPCWRSSSL